MLMYLLFPVGKIMILVCYLLTGNSIDLYLSGLSGHDRTNHRILQGVC